MALTRRPNLEFLYAVLTMKKTCIKIGYLLSTNFYPITSIDKEAKYLSSWFAKD